jgi:hypothetical protein
MVRWIAGLSAVLLLPACGSGSPDAEERNPQVPPALGSGQPPFVRIVSPGPRTSVPEGSTVTVQAVAGDPNAILAVVNFYDGDRLIGGKAAAPYFVSIGRITEGTHVLTAVAVDIEGVSAVSDPVTVFVVREPDEDEDEDD